MSTEQTIIPQNTQKRQKKLSESEQTDLVRLVIQLNAAATNIHFYSIDHPQARNYLESAFTTLTDILRARKEVTLLCIDDELVVDNQPVKSDGPHISQFTRILKESAIERITFEMGLPEENFTAFIKNLASPDEAVLRSDTYIKFGHVELRIKEGVQKTDTPLKVQEIENLEQLTEIRDLKYDEIKVLYQRAKRHHPVDIRTVDEMILAFIEGFSRGLNPMSLLASIKSSDEYTFTHVVNVCILTMSQAKSLGFSGQHLYNIGIASVLHDVGKLFIPDAIINKPGALTMKERKIIESHTTRGARYILGLKDIPKIAVLGALEHHINYDGTGYPSIVGGWKSNIVSQMIAIADVFDALRSRRTYSDPKPVDLIVKILKEEKGSAFNPFLVENFLKLIKQ